MIRVVGSHGVIWVEDDGAVREAPAAYAAIRRFDLPVQAPEALDILCVGYWVAAGTAEFCLTSYIPPEVTGDEDIEALNEIAKEVI